jgi:hypothetical protein
MNIQTFKYKQTTKIRIIVQIIYKYANVLNRQINTDYVDFLNN